MADDDIKLDPEVVNTVSQALMNAVTGSLIPDIEQMVGVVGALLVPGGGLYMEASSGPLNQEFTIFANSCTAMMNEIVSFANLFSQLSGSLVSWDQSYSLSISTGNITALTQGGSAAPVTPAKNAA